LVSTKLSSTFAFKILLKQKAFGATLIVPAQNLLLELQMKRLPTVFNKKRMRKL